MAKNDNNKGNSGNTNGGTEISFTHTPQAKDDLLGTLQSDQLDYVNTIYILDVMNNDLGGKAKSLWSVDDGINNSGAMSGAVEGDLLTQDAPGVTGIAANRSKFGAALHITEDGRVAYDTSAIDSQHAAALTGLALGETLTDSFIYAIRLADGTLSWANVSVTLTGVNDTPVVQNVSLSAFEDGGAVTGAFNGDDVDSDDDSSTVVYTIIGSPDTGTLTNNGDGTFTYDPGSNFQSLAQGEVAKLNLTYTATDRHNAISDPSDLLITVTGVNDAPTLDAGALGATEDGAAVFLDLAALGDDIDSDNDGSNLKYSLLNAAAGGVASISGTSLTFDPGTTDFQTLAVGETTSFDLQVQAMDKHDASAENTVKVTVTGVNDAAVVQDVAVAAVEDGGSVTGLFDGDDVDSDDDPSTLAYTIIGSPATGNGTLTNNDDGSFEFAPGGDFQSLAAGKTATINLTYTATDTHGLVSDPANLAITVTGINDAPTLATGALGATEDGATVTLDLATLGADVDSDDDGSTLNYSLQNTSVGGSASIVGTTLSFAPDSDFQSLAQDETTSFDLQVRATDAHGATADNTISVTVTGVNDAPQIQSGSDGTGVVTGLVPNPPFTVQQYLGYKSTSLTDLENYATNNAASYTVTTNIIDYTDDPAGFAGKIPGSSPWPAAQANGVTGTSHFMNDNFFVRITGQVHVTDTDTYTFRTYNDDGVFLRVNNTLIINDPGIHAELERTGTITLNPGVYPIELFFFEYDGEASLEFSYKNSTGSYELVDPNPMLSDSGVISFSDVDLTDTHTVSVSSASAMLGTLTATMTSDTTGSGTGGQVQWNYAVDNNAVRYLGEGDTKVETFTVTVSDGKGGVAQQQVDVTVKGINDVAELGNAVVDLTETDAQLTASGTLSITDVDDGEAFFNAQSDIEGTYGSLIIDKNGNWSFASDGALDHLTEGQVVTDIFNVTSVDGTATTVTVNITGTADGPTGVNDSNSLAASSGTTNTDNTVYWVDWTGATYVSQAFGRDPVYNVQGTITLPTKTIDVTYQGQIFGLQVSGGTDFYVTKSGSTVISTEGVGVYTSADVPNGPTNNDIIRLHHADSPRTLSFSEPIENLFFAIVSMNANGYIFDQDFRVVSSADSSSDAGFFGYASSYNITTSGDGRYGISTPEDGNNEFHGVLAIDNALASLTWNSQSHENWNGFTIGTYGVASTATVGGNVLSNDIPDISIPAIEVSAVDGQAMVGNSVTLTLASGAILKVDKNGDYLYDDNGKFASLVDGQSHTDSVVYTVTDSAGYTDTATLTITVDGVDDPAVLGDAVVNLTETDAQLNAGGTLSITDPDAGQAFFTAQSNTAGTYGNFSIDTNGNWSFASNGALDHLTEGQVVTDVFDVTSVDGTATTVTVNITGTADGPTAVNDSNSLSASTVVPNNSNQVYWVDWQSVTITGPRVGNSTSGDAPVRVEGTITLGNNHVINVTYEGLAMIVQANEQKYVYTGTNLNEYEYTQPNANNLPYTSSEVNAPPTTKDIIGLNEAFTGGGSYFAGRTDFSPRNLTFSEPVENLFFAVVSMNSNGYLFDQNFQIVSQGEGKYGVASPISPTSFGGGQYGIVSTGEFHGVLKIDGSVEQLTWTSQNKETWNGFTVGTYGQAQTSSATGNVLTNDVADSTSPTIEVSSVGGSNMVGNSVTLTLASGATLKVDRDGDYFYDDGGKFAALGAGDSHTENVEYTVRDNAGNVDTATLSITVNGVNDVAVLGSAVVNLTETDSALSTSGTLSIADVDAGEASFNAQTNTVGSYGTFNIGANGAWSYNTNGALDHLVQGNVVSDVFNVTSIDGTTTTVTVNITGTSLNIVAPGNLAQNGSFENNLTSWSTLGGGVDRVDSTGWQAAKGSHSLDLNAQSPGGVQQTVATQNGTTYGVFFQISKNYDSFGTIDSATMRVSAAGSTQDYTFAEKNSSTNMLWRGETFGFTDNDASTTSTILSFESLSTSSNGTLNAKGPALDDVVILANTIVSGFDKLDGDVLSLGNLLTSIGAPLGNLAFTGGYLRFQQSGSDTLVQVDPNGGGDDYLTAVTLIGVNLTEADTGNYII